MTVIPFPGHGDDDDPHAYARNTDPPESWAAAYSLTPDELRASQEAVWRVLDRYGPLDDTRLVAQYHQTNEVMQTEQSIRTRRSELVAKDLVEWTGGRVPTLNGGRRLGKVWRTKQPDPQPSTPPPTDLEIAEAKLAEQLARRARP